MDLRGIYELLTALIALCSIEQMYLLHTNLPLEVMLLLDAIIFGVFLEGIIFHRDTNHEPKGTEKRIVWTLVLILLNVIIFVGIQAGESVMGMLSAGFLLICFNFDQLGAFLIFKYDNRKLKRDVEEKGIL